ncbi:MAG: TetR/AcrR family transcriptional regulator [Candidatus Bipolaricaulota bacterium]|nr:TetR/AcrR family transcriptional regulator [Candidatus Bipolaricaulota bacterium]
MSRKSSAERQQEIVQAVLDLIAEQGVQGVTMARIADRVGITEAALYRHFRGKMEIVAATIDTTFDELWAMLTASAGSGTTCEMLKNVLIAHLRFIEKRPGMARILFSDEVHFNSPALRKKLFQRGEQVASFVAGLLHAGSAAGELQANLDVKNATVLYRGIVQAQVLLWAHTEKKGGLANSAAGIWTLYEKAIRP